jgi:hypothetical protein
MVLSSSLMVQTDEKQQVLISSLLHYCSSSSQVFLVISPSKLDRKGSKTRLERRSMDSQSLKSIWFTFWPAVVFVTFGAWLLAG